MRLKLTFLLFCCIMILSCTSFRMTDDKCKVGDAVSDTATYTMVFFATWDAESVVNARRIGKQLLSVDSLVLVSLDDKKSITQEIVNRSNLDLYYDTIVYYKDNPKLYKQFLDDTDNIADEVSVVFIQNGRIKMIYKRIE